MRKKQGLYFGIALAVQLVILAAVPAGKLNARLNGTLISIKTAPFDPYDFLSGYHVRLTYEISTPPGLQELKIERRRNAEVYVELKKEEDGTWSAGNIYRERPSELPGDSMVIKGRFRRSRIDYGIESYFIPEENRQEIEKALREQEAEATAQIKVDSFGNAAMVSLTVNGKVYEY